MTKWNIDSLNQYRKLQSEKELMRQDYEEVLTDHRRLVRELDVIINGENAAQQASLCDIVSQLRSGSPPATFMHGLKEGEVERLKGLIEKAHDSGYNSGLLEEGGNSSWQQFKTDNNL